AGQQRRGLHRLHHRPQPVEGAQVVGEVAVGRDHRGAPAEHRVAGEHGAVLRQVEAQRVERVPGRARDAQLQVAHRYDVAVGEALRAEPVARVEGAYRSAGELREPGRTAA